jgi:polar amino acid transport system substrate-binding protein
VLWFEARSKLMYMVAHAVQTISVLVAPDGGMKIAAEYHTEMSR